MMTPPESDEMRIKGAPPAHGQGLNHHDTTSDASTLIQAHVSTTVTAEDPSSLQQHDLLQPSTPRATADGADVMDVDGHVDAQVRVASQPSSQG